MERRVKRRNENVSMIRKEEIAEIGLFRKPHGVKGEISAELDVPADELKSFSAIVCEMEGIYVPFFIESVRQKGQVTALLTIDGFDTDVAVKKFSNKRIYVLRKELLESDVMEDGLLIGFDILMADGKRIGTVTDVDDSTANVLFVVDGNNGELYIPVVDDFILEINEQDRFIIVDMPEGMIESQLN